MKKIIFTLLSATFALSAFAQLAVPFTFTQDNFNDGSVVIANVNEGKEDTPAKWSSGIYFGGSNTMQDGFNWEDKYIIIAIDGIADLLSFETTTVWSATRALVPSETDYFWYISESETQDFGSPIWTSIEQKNKQNIELSKTTKYIKLCYTGNLNGTITNFAVSKYTPVATAATAVTANSFTANWNAAKGTNITYTLEVSDANGVVKTIDNLTGTSYTVEELNSFTAYSYVVYVVANGTTTSDASNAIEVTTLLAPTTALDATDVTHKSFVANWEASDLEGATYTIDVKNADDESIAFASGLEETSYAVSELDIESTYTYVIYVSVGDATSEASNTISVTTLAKPAITPAQYEYKLNSDTGIEGYTSIIITAVNVTEATATVTGDAEFYFKDADGNHVTTKTLPIEAEGPTEFELYSMFTEGGEYSATVTISAADADDAIVSVTATATFVVPATKALDATDVTYKSFVANWVASDLEGATYSIEVKNGADETIASASGLEETSYTVSNLEPESTYTYVVYATVSEVTSDASNTIEVTTLEKPVITPVQDEYTLLSDTDIEGYMSVLLTAVNVTEVTATIEGDAEFYFKDADGNPVTTKTLTIEAAGPTEFELFSYFNLEGDYSATITFSAEDADNAYVSVIAKVSTHTNVAELKSTSKVKSFNNGVLEFNEDYASIVVSTLIGKTVIKGQGHSIALAKGQAYIVETVDFEGKKSTIKVQ